MTIKILEYCFHYFCLATTGKTKNRTEEVKIDSLVKKKVKRTCLTENWYQSSGFFFILVGAFGLDGYFFYVRTMNKKKDWRGLGLSFEKKKNYLFEKVLLRKEKIGTKGKGKGKLFFLLHWEFSKKGCPWRQLFKIRGIRCFLFTIATEEMGDLFKTLKKTLFLFVTKKTQTTFIVYKRKSS